MQDPSSRSAAKLAEPSLYDNPVRKLKTRLTLIDGLRGYFLVGMFINHVSGGRIFQGGFHSPYTYVEDAQGFIFISGLLVGFIFGQRIPKHGFASEARSLWRRGAKIYVWYLGCLIITILMGLILPGSPGASTWGWTGIAPLIEGRGWFLLASALLLYQPAFLDILSQYVVYVSVSPLLIWLCLTRRWTWVVVGSVALWLAVQLGLLRPLADATNYIMSALDPDLDLRAYFNIFAWQLLFVNAMVLGTLWAQDRIEFHRIFDPQKTLLFSIFSVLLVFIFLIKVSVGEAAYEAAYSVLKREEFSLGYLMNFILLAYVISWLLIAGPRSNRWLIAKLGLGLKWLFGLSFLRLLGRHSLVTYAWHVVLVYFYLWSRSVIPLDNTSEIVLAFCGVGLLALPAAYMDRQALKHTPHG